jgi:hypothetical protein
MNDRNDWDKPDWDWPPPVVFVDLPFSRGAVMTAILVGGIIAGVIAAIWHMAVSIY